MAEMNEVERQLRHALVPVEPSVGLSDRLEQRLAELTGMAVDELADWDATAMRDPRNWGRPVAAILVGSAAAGALGGGRARFIMLVGLGYAFSQIPLVKRHESQVMTGLMLLPLLLLFVGLLGAMLVVWRKKRASSS